MARHSFFCIDGHTCGNPVRLVAGGGPRLEGATMIEKRAHFLAEYDWIRTGLMFEPRGHDMMSGSILYAPTRPDCDVAVLFIETSGCLPMCGHGTIGTVTMAIEHGLVTPREPGVLRLDTPAGVVVASYRQDGSHVEEVRITNVASFVHSRGLEVDCPGLGRLVVDVAYGGNFYAIVDAQQNFRDIVGFFRRAARSAQSRPAPSAQRRLCFRASRKARHPGSQPRPVDRGAEGCARHGTQRRLLWRERDRPVALRYRHLCPDGALGCDRPSERGR